MVHALRLAGLWNEALTLVPAGEDGAALRAEILTDRHLWRLDPVDEARDAVAAIGATHPRAATLYRAQLEYWRQLHPLEQAPIGGDPVDAFAGLLPDGAGGATDDVGRWATFWHAVALENLRGEPAPAGAGYERARLLARDAGDPLLESYAVRHLGAQAHWERHDLDQALPLLRRSAALRAACGARPHVAAAQAMLVAALGPDDPESVALREIASSTAEELGLTWLTRSLANP
jgi:hypothetical protein